MPQRRFLAFDIAAFSVELIERHLGLVLLPGIVHFSARAQDHAFEKHGDEFLRCRDALEATIAFPHYVGQGPQHVDEFELVRKLGADYTLAAMSTRRDDEGRYLLLSLYRIDEGTVITRLKRKRLFTAAEIKNPA
jgi:hypothetical protein